MSYSNPQIGYAAGTDIIPTPPGPSPGLPSSQPDENLRNLTDLNVMNFGFDAGGRDVNSIPWANLLNYIQNLPPVAGRTESGARAVRIIFPRGDFCLNNLSITGANLRWNGMITIEGQGDETRIFPGGGQGQALTINGTGGSLQSITVRNLRLGYGAELVNPDLPYSQPILTIIRPVTYLLDSVTGFISGTGTILSLVSAFNGSMRSSFLNAGTYGVSINYIDTVGTDADTISFRDTVLEGLHGLLCNAAFVETMRFDETKFVSGTGDVNSAESFLAASSAVNATTISLNPGDGALFAVNDCITIGEPGTGSAAGYGIEVNKITQINADTLTLEWPLQFSHDTGHHVPVIRGGTLLALPAGTHCAKITSSHFEHTNIGIFITQATLVEIGETTTFSCLKAIRLGAGLTSVTSGASDIKVDSIECLGANIHAGGSENKAVDIPSWVPLGAATTPTRLFINGPLEQGFAPIQQTVNLFGTIYNIDRDGYIALTLSGSFTVSGFSPFGVKIGSAGLQFRGLLAFAGALAQGTLIFTLPPPMVPVKSKLFNNYQNNSQSTTAAPVLGVILLQGQEQGANAGKMLMEVASTAAGYLSLDSLPVIAIS